MMWLEEELECQAVGRGICGEAQYLGTRRLAGSGMVRQNADIREYVKM